MTRRRTGWPWSISCLCTLPARTVYGFTDFIRVGLPDVGATRIVSVRGTTSKMERKCRGWAGRNERSPTAYF
ncbi:hypothetical protein DFH08DRAFT_896136 [Mycena albidolilacea]|uniref:Secreted protein n=1 Tax=Mycena albidolilacea TaxID=1033008 RepID=A0AAD6ZA51_9AGAR|nr:hypothetical protein DFH08DRAFT_896136 [Mycena albidolilacea]